MRGRATIWGAALLVLVVLLAACSGADDEGGDASSVGTSSGVAGSGEARVDEARGAVDADEQAAGEADDAPAEADPDDALGGVGEGGTVVPAAITSPERVIKDGTVRIEVAEDGFDTAFAAVVEVAQRLGGGVTASSTSSSPDGGTSGSLTVRVPVDAYEQLLVGVGEVGEVVDRRITSQDVSEEFVDLEARRRQLRVQEEFWTGLLAEATAVEDAVRIRGELDRVQADIERITGRLSYLEDRTSFSTLTVELFEPGVAIASATPGPASLASYWATGLEALTAAVGTLLVVALGGLPLVAVAGIAWMAVRTLRRRPAESVPPAPSPSA